LVQLLALLLPLGATGYWGLRQAWGYYHSQAARKALAGRHFVEAREHLNQCLSVWPRDLETCLLAAQAARRSRDTEGAAKLLEKYASLRGTSAALEVERALLQAQTGELDAETEGGLWTLLRRNDPRSPSILEVLAPYYLDRYRFDTALQCLTRWLELQPDAVQALLWRAQIFLSLDHKDEAIKNCRHALEIDPDFDDARLYLAQILIGTNVTEEAAQHLEILRQRHSEKPDVILGLAVCRYKQGRTQEAEQLLELLVDQPMFRAAALRELGRIALDSGRTAEAEKRLRASLVSDPFYSDTLYCLARCMQALGQPTEAAKIQERQAKVDADAKRLKELVGLLAREPGSADLRYEAGMICQRNGQAAEARRWFRGALEINPQHLLARRALESAAH
jgi:tetratricopeptide (TPR) repeat protein